MGKQSWRFDEKELEYIKEVLGSGDVSSTLGNMNTRLEKAFAEKMNLKYAVTMNSGTTTLHTALKALGVGYGDEVILSPLTVMSCLTAIIYCNAIPVFADVDTDTFLIDPKSIEEKITKKTKVIMPIHLYGLTCDMSNILKIAKKHNLYVLEDCAQAFLAKHKGQIAGSMGDVASWSFENTKHMTTGDGGAIACNNEALAEEIRRLSTQGYKNVSADSGKVRANKEIFQQPNYKRHSKLGFMYRLPEVAAAMGMAQLEKLDYFIQKRREMASIFQDTISDCPYLNEQKTEQDDFHSYWTFTLRYTNEDVNWQTFRKKFMELGGDGIYASWALLYQEDNIDDIKNYLDPIGLKERFNAETGQCPIAEKIQPQLMQFTTNQIEEDDRQKQAKALRKTIDYFSS